jgi:predicted permease
MATAVALYPRDYDSAAVRGPFVAQFFERARHIPGVTSAARASILPLMDNAWQSGFQVVGRATNDANVESQHWFVSPEYFATLRIPLLRGRLFTEADRDAPVILLNETFARRYFPGQNPIGQRLTFDKATIPGMTEFTIVGVVGDVRDRSLIEPARIAIIHPTSARSGSFVLLRTDGDPAALVAPLRAILHEMDPRLALSPPRFLEEMRAQSMARQRFFAMVLGIFAVVGLVLATVGVYGVLAQLARGRAREMGIRVALGAPLARVRWLVVGHGMRLAVTGLIIGGVVALFATRALTSLLFGVAPHDPLAFGGVVVVLIGASAAASWIPALRTTRESPAAVLRSE